MQKQRCVPGAHLFQLSRLQEERTMPIPLNPHVADALNRQINSELAASHVYRAMSAYFDAQELSGFGAWFRAHSDEEIKHAMRLYDYLVKRDARVEFSGIDRPGKNYPNPEAAVAAALEMETEVTRQINELFELVHESKEYGAQPLMHWFLGEQVNEEDLFRRLLDQVKATEDSRWHLLTLDRELAERGGK
ncbi:MAG: ferritin [Alphaproteobacteria bacterium]|nr:ferritin [Alphaproteobacteria bacterium]